MTTEQIAGKSRKVLLSAVQPSNRLTIGNYLGAIRNWVQLQKEYDCVFFAVDLHAITVRQDPAVLREQTLRVIATYISCGIDPADSTLFVQSHVPAHAELAWVLSCFIGVGELSRMTQFKDKSRKQEAVSTGLLTYPALMAADILLYQADLVPVGQDQKQHVELTRDVAQRVNQTYDAPLFRCPDPYVASVASRIMSLADPETKMSKSDPNPRSAIYLNDSNDSIKAKFRSAVTDSHGEVVYDESRPGVRNLIEIQSALTGESPALIVNRYAGKGYGYLKLDTADLVVSAVEPIRERTARLLADRNELENIIHQGAENARARARTTMRRLYEAVGFFGARNET